MNTPLLVNIMGTDCTNNGITSGQEYAMLYPLDYPKSKGFSERYPSLVLKKGYGNRKLMAVPFKEKSYPMFGGHFVYSSDSRFPSDQPIHVHDRFE